MLRLSRSPGGSVSPAAHLSVRSPQTARDRITKHSFELRLFLTLAAVLAVVGGVRYVHTSNSLEGQLVRDALAVGEGQAQALQRTYLAHSDRHQSEMMAAAVIDGIIVEAGVTEAALIAPDGSTVVAVADDPDAPDGVVPRGEHAHSDGPAGDEHPAHPDPGHGAHEGHSSHSAASGSTGDHHGPEGDDAHAGHEGAGAGSDTPVGAAAGGADADPHHTSQDHGRAVDEVLGGGEPVVVRAGTHADFEFWLPVELPTGRHVLHIGMDRSRIDAHLADLRRSTAWTTLVGLVAAVVLFYIFGGRALATRHRAAVESSRRDSLTGLGNHRAFQEEVRRSVERAERARHPATCVLIDVDFFKQVNDQNGHAHGDQILRIVALELGRLREGDMAFRIGGDEFALLFEHTDAATAHRLIEGIRSRLHDVSISAGVADTHSADVESPSELVQRADAALYEAKRSGRNQCVIYQEGFGHGAVRPAEERELTAILALPEIPIAFQPIWDVEGIQAIGYEALARPPAGPAFAGPGPMFSAAHALDRLPELDALCRRSALRQFAAALAAGANTDGASVFLNVSPHVLVGMTFRPGDLVGEVAEAGLSPESVVLEITEREVVDVPTLAGVVGELRRAGFRVALDDVGSANAGLELLRRVRTEFLKIDRQVIVEALDGGPSRGVLLAILTFAREARSFVIAEGIENVELLDFVAQVPDSAEDRALVIQGVQGFLPGRPDEHPNPGHGAALLREHRRRLAGGTSVPGATGVLTAATGGP